MSNKNDRYRKIGLAFVVILAAAAMLYVVLSSSITSIAGGKQYLVAPGKSEMKFEKAGTYLIYYEYRSLVDGKSFNTVKDMRGIKCVLKEKASGDEIILQSQSGNTKYDIGNHEGYSIYKFKIDRPGTYELACTGQSNGNDQQFVIAVGKGIAGSIVIMVFGILGVAFITPVLLLLIFTKKRILPK